MKHFVLYLIIALLLCGCGGQPEEYVFLFDDVEISLNSPAGPVLYALGKPLSCTQEPSCAFQGMETTYNHGSFCITTYEAEGSEYIYRLWLLDDTAATAEGLRLGDSREKALECYPQAQFNEFRGLLQWEGGSLTLLLEADRVSGIVYQAETR